MTAHWFAVNSHPNKEDTLFRAMQGQGLEVFFPCIKVHPVNPRSRKFRPYFPGYLFVRVDLEEAGMSVLQWMPHSKGLVSYGGEPAIVPDRLIHAIHKRMEEISQTGGGVQPGLTTGDTVTIESGPFEGYEAIFDLQISGSERVRVLLNLLNKNQLPLELSAGNIRKTKAAARKR